MPAPVLRTLAICDLVDSTGLVEKFGDQRGAEIMRQHDRLARDLVEHHQGREIDKTDGFLILFERPIHAVGFALDYQRALRALSAKESLPLAARIGIHVGDVVLWDNVAHDVARGAKPVEVEGLVKPTAARIMSIARPGQILLSSMASTLAQRARAELGDTSNLRWQAHGNYRFKGVPDPVQVHEVGEEGIAPFRAPAWTGKAHREIPWWRRPGMLFVEAAVVIAAVAVPAYFSLRSPTAIAFAERDWVVVGDLRNQTGQGVLDDSLDTAFRVSLEQSRFVNLVSSLQVNDALKRMQKPGGTKIDREIGSEIAIREGARALILPTVAEVGGRVRVTAEVVDPHTQATVYAETADGTGLDSILPSVGKVSGELRGRLGEAVASIEANNAPLPKVTTGNLDALRAYSLGLQAYRKAQYADALGLFQQAIKLDSDFALAYMGMARIYEGQEDTASARQATTKALSLKERMSARDQLYLEAWASRWGPPTKMLKKWQLLGQVYPDYYAAAYNYAYFAWHLENRASAAIQVIQPALSEHNPQRAGVHYTLAFLQAVENQFMAAEENFATAATLGDIEVGGARIATYAAQRRYNDAEKLLNGAKTSGFAASDLFISLQRVTIGLDRGEWAEARKAAENTAGSGAKAGPATGRAFRAMQLSVDENFTSHADQANSIRSFLAGVRAAAEDNENANNADDVLVLLFGAYLATRADDHATARSALTFAMPLAKNSGFPNLEHMLAIVDAELSLRAGKPRDAIAVLLPTINGSELYLTHVALADAYTAAGLFSEALAETQWLREHRARAYLETNTFHMLQPRNVAESDLAILRSAELNSKLGRRDASEKDLRDFLSTWPQSPQLGFISDRVSALSKN